MRERIFEPRVTSKLDTMVVDRWGVHGRGMALFSVRSNVESARLVASDPHRGSSLVVVSDTSKLAEKADQSKWPTVERDLETGKLVVATGPHNIVRRVVEFAVEHPDLEVFLGTPTEIVASMVAHARGRLDARQLLFCDDPMDLPVWLRPAVAGDAAELVSLCASIGLAISERTGHRVLGGELDPVDSVIESVAPTPEVADPRQPDIYRDRRGLRIAPSDTREFQRRLEEAFDLLAERYYLHLSGEPKVTVGRDSITVRFPVEKDD
jgi:hypothetical protein